jgi:cobalt-zinc-cadmium efflux system protein
MSAGNHRALHGEGAHHHAHSGASQAKGGTRRRLLVAAILTSGMMIAEAAGGLIAGSLALLADAGHMLTDAVALVLAYVAQRVSDRPGNRWMTYGFDRLQILIAYTNGLTVVLIALWIVVEAVDRLLAPTPVLGGAMFVIAALGLAVNGIVFLVLHGGDRQSLNLRGAILHVAGDLLGSVAAIAAASIILMTGWTAADPLLSVLVALILLRSAWRLIRESGLILLEGTPPHINRNDVAYDLVASVAGVSDVHHMHVWSLDGRRLMATLHVRLAAGADAETSIGAIKARLSEEHGIGHATVEIETGTACPDEREARRKHGTSGG